MSVLMVRHGVSRANDKNSAAFGHPDAELIQKGIFQAIGSGRTLYTEYGISPLEPVASSCMKRSEQSARFAGFAVIAPYLMLNEVSVPKGINLRQVLDRHEILPEAYAAAEQVLADPPPERVWYTHGYLMAAICDITGAPVTDGRFIAPFGGVRAIPIEPGIPAVQP